MWIVPGGNSGAACASADGARGDVLRGNPVRDVDQLRRRRERQHHALHRARIAVAGAEIGRERHDGHGRRGDYPSGGEYRTTRRPAVIIERANGQDRCQRRRGVADMFDGATILAGGFGLCGIPENLIARHRGARGPRTSRSSPTTAASTTRASASCSRNGQVKKMISSYVGENKMFERQFLVGRARGRAEPAGHARRAPPRRRRRHPGVLHADRLRHGGRRGQGDARVRRAAVRARDTRCAATSRS